jgi:hypothetical protein
MIILLFNIGGYRLAINFLQNRSDQRLEASIDNKEYDESRLIEIKVALNMPYQERFTDFERHYGEIEIDGKSYTYVKRKIQGDVVIFKCIANESKEQLQSLQNDLAKANTGIDMNHSQQKHHNLLVKNSLSEFEDLYSFQPLLRIATQAGKQTTAFRFFLTKGVLNTPHQPPEVAVAIS